MKSRVTLLFPSAASAPRQRADAKEQAEHGRAQKVGDIGQIHRSGRERLEMHRERHVDEQRVEGIGKQMPYSSMIHNSRKMLSDRRAAMI